MTVATAASSLLDAAIFVGAGSVVAVIARRRLFPSADGSLAVTVIVLVWLCWALALGQLLGAMGLLRRGALLGGAVLTASVALLLARAIPRPRPTATRPYDAVRGSPGRSTRRSRSDAGRQEQILTVGTVLVVLFVGAIWAARTFVALHRGINDPDSLGYHVPFAVSFAQSGYADQTHVLVPLLPVQFFPGNDELLSAIALALTHSLAFAAAKNLIYGALAVVAAHAVGKEFGAGRLTMVAAAVLLGTPVIGFSQPGEAVNDTLLLLLLIGALAVLAHAREKPAPYLLAMACAGAIVGVKFSGIVPGAALGAFALILMRARVPTHRWAWGGAGLFVSAALGVSWYIRNAAVYGNPVPPVHLAVGSLHLHTVRGVDAAIAYSVAHYALHGRLLGVFAHGLVLGVGPFGVILAAASGVAAVVTLRRGDGFRVGLVIVAAAALVGYVFTPASAYGPPNAVPGSFVINLHYAAPGLVVMLFAGALVAARWPWAWLLPGVAALAIASSISRGRSISVWSPEMGGPGFVLLVVAAAIGGLVAWSWLYPRRRPVSAAGAGAAALLVLVAAVLIVGRYPRRQSTDPVVNWASTVRGARIGGWVANIADLYGPRASNKVVILTSLDDQAAMPVATCQQWKQALVRGGFGYTAAPAGTPWASWIEADPAFRPVADERVGATREDLVNARRNVSLVFAVVGRPDMSCPGQSPAPTYSK